MQTNTLIITFSGDLAEKMSALFKVEALVFINKSQQSYFCSDLADKIVWELFYDLYSKHHVVVYIYTNYGKFPFKPYK